MQLKSKKVLFLVLFLVGTVAVFAFRLWQVRKTKSVSFSPQKSSFVLKPPADALKGKLLLVEGKVEKESREKEEFEEVGIEEEILQGEKLTTGEKSKTAVEFPDFLKIELASDTEIGLVNLIPANFLISQSSGFVTYKLLQSDRPVSVRSLHALFTFNSGESELTVKEEEITVKVLSGKAKLTLVDLENETHLWELEGEQKVLINDSERRVEIK